MTMQEVKRRAANIWGGQRIISIIRQQDGTIDVNLWPAGIASDTRARNYSAHRLDATGRIICHDDCTTLDEVSA